METTEYQPTETSVQKELDQGIKNLVDSSTLPDELKRHFIDILVIFYRGVDQKAPAKQILNILEELNLAKREYCQNNNLPSLPEANILINEISNKLMMVSTKQ